MSKYAPKCATTGNSPYLRTETTFGRDSHRIEYAATLAEAKAQHGWTRMRYTRVTMRRATTEDRTLTDYGWCGCPDDCNKANA